MLHEPGQSAYDLQFKLFDFPVRVSWGFWLMTALLGWRWSQQMDLLGHSINVDSPGAPALLIIWIACVFLSILVHELGHALAYRYYGQRARIVLYHFGGLAVSDSFNSWNGARRYRTSAKDDIIISAAGPAAQILLALVVCIVGILINVAYWPLLQRLGVSVPDVSQWSTISLYAAFDALVECSVFWAVLNLAPLLPLDGGQIMHNLLQIFGVRDSWVLSRKISIATGVVLGIWLTMSYGTMNGIMFFMLAAMNWQDLQQGRGF